jgi:hypothetical protein
MTRRGPVLLTRHKLAWMLPIAYGFSIVAIILSSWRFPDLLSRHSVQLFVAPACIVAPIGGWWAIYQCVRYERNPGRYLMIVMFIPFGFAWYYFERYRPHRDQVLKVSGT